MKINTSTIENYDNMTAEEKLAAIEALDIQDTDTEKRYKDLISKANAEAKKYKDAMRTAEEKLNGHLSEEERAQKERDEHIKAIEEENAQLKREMTVTQKTAFYQSIGFDEGLAKATAEAFVDGDFDTVESNQRKAHEEFEKSIRADVIRQTPHPQNVGTESKTMTKKEIMGIRDPKQRQKAIAEHPELF